MRQAWTRLTPAAVPATTDGYVATHRMGDGTLLIMGPFPTREAAQQLGPHWTITPTPETQHD